MTTALVKASTLVILPSDLDGDPVYTKARSIEVSGPPTFSDQYDTIERNVVRQAFSSYAPLRGLESTSSTITLELHGSGIATKPPESALLYKGAFGAMIAPVAAGTDWTSIIDDELSTVIDTGGEGTYTPLGTSPEIYSCTITVDSATDFAVEYPVRIYSGTTIRTIGFITEVSGDDITFITQNNGALTAGDTVDCGFLFSLRNLDKTQVANLTPANFDYFRGDITKEHWTKNTSTEFSIDFSTGQVCLPSFNFEGAEVGYTTQKYADANPAYSLINTTYDSENTTPLVVQLADIFMSYLDTNDDTQYFQDCISNVQFSITNDVFKKQCIGTLGIGEVLRTSRNVSGSLNTFYTNKDFQDAFRAETSYKLRSIFNYSKSLDATGLKQFDGKIGNIIALSIPNLQFSEVGIEEDSGIFKYANSFSAQPVEGDDELYLAFL